MSEYEENIYGNQEIVRQHAGGSKPIKVCRPEGLGQESPADVGEEFLYANKAAMDGRPNVPSIVRNDRRPRVQQDSMYEVFDSNEGRDVPKQRISGKPANYNYKDATNDPNNGTNAKVSDKSIELKDMTFDYNVALEKASSTPTTTHGKGKEYTTNRWPVFLGGIAVLLSLIAIGLALLFGFRIIKTTNECECRSADLDLLRNQVKRLQEDFDQLKSKNVASSSRTISYIPSSLVLFSTVASAKAESTVFSEEMSPSKGMALSKGMTVAPTRSFATSLYTQSTFFSTSYTGNSSEITNTTVVP